MSHEARKATKRTGEPHPSRRTPRAPLAPLAPYPSRRTAPYPSRPSRRIPRAVPLSPIEVCPLFNRPKRLRVVCGCARCDACSFKDRRGISMSPRLVASLLILTCYVSIALAGHGPELLKEAESAESASLAEEGGLMISHLRGRTPEIGADIWDNSTLPDLRCSMAGGGRSGCSSAPACDNVGQCTQKEMTCTAYKWTECRGCFVC